MIDSILKRDYSKKPFKLEKITNAILQAMLSENIGGLEDATKISSSVYSVLLYNQKRISNYTPSVEEIQDLVETELMKSEFKNVAKSVTSTEPDCKDVLHTVKQASV